MQCRPVIYLLNYTAALFWLLRTLSESLFRHYYSTSHQTWVQHVRVEPSIYRHVLRELDLREVRLRRERQSRKSRRSDKEAKSRLMITRDSSPDHLLILRRQARHVAFMFVCPEHVNISQRRDRTLRRNFQHLVHKQ